VVSIALLREMFTEMVVAKNPELVGRYYDPDFELTTNGTTQDYAEFEAGHRRVYGTDISYAVEYDEQAWVESGDGVAGRIWITTRRGDADPTRIEVVLVVRYRDGRIHRVWELTWPDWSALEAFEDYG